MSPYATGGGGVTFERKVAVRYLGQLLTGLGASELGEGRSVVAVAFQQSPEHAADDLVIRAKRPDEDKPSLVLGLAVRRAPSIVKCDEKSRKLVGSFLAELANDLGEDVEHQVGLVVAGHQAHASQLAELAGLARGQSDAASFVALIQEPKRFERAIRDRLEHLQELVKLALEDATGGVSTDETVTEHAWRLLSHLQVVLPRFESPDESDWAGVANELITVARTQDVTGAALIRDRLSVLAGEYAPKAAVVDLTLLRRDTHHLIAPTIRRHRDAWQLLNGLHQRAVAAVGSQVTSADGARQVHIDRSATVTELRALATANDGVVVHGESGVGKSALLVEAAAAADEGEGQALVVNLRHLPATAIELEGALGAPLADILAELSAPERLLIIDGADGIAEGKAEQFRYLVEAALRSDVRVVALTSNDVQKLVYDAFADFHPDSVATFEVEALTNGQVDELIETFPELSALAGNVRARELLRRLVVVDLLVRGGVSGVPLTDADAMQHVWAGLVRRRGQVDRGMPDARDAVMLRLAELAVTGGDPLPVVTTLDGAALDGLRRDGVLRTATDEPFKIGPEFAHDEVRRYAVARLLLGSNRLTARLLAAGMPRWSLGASRLACQMYLCAPSTPANPVAGRLARLQGEFDAVVVAGHGERWADVPSEALLALPEQGSVLADAWAELCAHNKAGLYRLCRLIDQRFRDSSHLVRVTAVEPLIKQLLSGATAWRGDERLQELIRDWLRSLIAADVPAGDALKAQLRSQLLGWCAVADQRQRDERAAAEAARAARTPEEVERDERLAQRSDAFDEIGYPRSRRRRRRDVPREITDEVTVELLALLGPDLGDEGEAILRRIGSDAPWDLGPAVEGLLAARALAHRSRGFLAELTESYYIDEDEDGSGFHEDGIRDHDFHGFGMPHAAWYSGPFMSLLQTDFRGGVRAINRMLNHAARARVRTLASIGHYGAVSDEELERYRTELQVTGTARTYIGDSHVWIWYRGTGVGPYPCMSALQALERVVDQLIQIDIPLEDLVPVLLDGCESLAMVGFVVGLLVRHIEKSDRLLDPYLSEPVIWQLEFGRVVQESSGLAASSDGVVGGDRRSWSLREAAMMLVLRADEARAEELRQVAQVLVERAAQDIRSAVPGIDDAEVQRQLVSVRGWASGMDRNTYSAEATDDGQVLIQSTPPEPLLDALQSGSVDIQRGHEATRLFVEYHINSKKGLAEPRSAETLVADLTSAEQLLAEPPGLSVGAKWDAPVAVAAAALEAHLIDGVGLPVDSLRFAAETVIAAAEIAGQERQFESEESYFEQGADRVAARVLPVLLLPYARDVRTVLDGHDGTKTYARVAAAATSLASSLPNEVRVYLARGLDRLWQVPCAQGGRCHHEDALDLVIATMRDCALGNWDSDTGRRATVLLADPITQSLQQVAGDAIDFRRLDAALRALAPAVVADIGVSERAEALFTAALAAQRRALLAHERDMDHRGTHALISARALLTLIENGNDELLFEHLDAFADRSDLLGVFIRAVSAAGEESTSRASTAARIWPTLVSRVLGYEKDHKPFEGRHYGDYARASLMPNLAGEVAYLYRETAGAPIVWWNPRDLASTVEEWLLGARGDPTCTDHLISFVRALDVASQVRLGLPWIADLVLADPDHIARRSYLLSTWLIEVRSAVTDDALLATWQRVVDALVVAGDSSLAPYSE
ncbi:hypothetical protein [Serinicoccus chungangensis]|uniref:hypothetical protein n=1 Tax=Serinicoccus chungangensis TaxID=767452 RepID=UPI00128EBEF0|nr:hypothetical protein [Serinicoccus chungangensis]